MSIDSGDIPAETIMLGYMAVKSRFFRSVFLETTAITSIVHRVCAPMFLAQVAVFLGTYLLRDSGTMVSTRSLCTLLLAV